MIGPACMSPVGQKLSCGVVERTPSKLQQPRLCIHCSCSSDLKLASYLAIRLAYQCCGLLAGGRVQLWRGPLGELSPPICLRMAVFLPPPTWQSGMLSCLRAHPGTPAPGLKTPVSSHKASTGSVHALQQVVHAA